MKISDYCTYAPKSKIKAGDANPNGKYQFYASSPDKSRRCDEYLYDCKAIIMGTGGSATLHYYDGKFSTSTDCLTLIPNENIRAKYLYYFFLANMDVLEAGFKGAGLKHTNKGYIDNIEITKIPSLSSQDKIVNLFDELASIIEKERRQIEKLDDLIKARFVEMFGNNKYETRIIKDVLRESFWLMPATPKYIDEGIPYITSKNIKNRILDLDDTKFISENDYVKISKNRPIKPGDILISMIGTLGQIAVVSKNKRFYGQNVYLLRLNNDVISTSFFCEFFNSDDVQNKLAGKSNQSTQAYLKANHVEDLLIPVPPIAIQHDFTAFVTQVDKSKFMLSNELAMCNFYVRLINDSITHSRIDLRMSK